MTSSVLVCSMIPGLKRALEKQLPTLTFVEVGSEELTVDQAKTWKSQIIVSDNALASGLLYTNPDNVAFVQVPMTNHCSISMK